MFGFFAKQDINKGVHECKATDSAVLLDVRSTDEYRGGHIPGSVNIDVSEISKAPSLVSGKATPLFVYCHSGSRSGMAVTLLKRMGYTNVKNIGGITAYAGSIEKGN